MYYGGEPLIKMSVELDFQSTPPLLFEEHKKSTVYIDPDKVSPYRLDYSKCSFTVLKDGIMATYNVKENGREILKHYFSRDCGKTWQTYNPNI